MQDEVDVKPPLEASPVSEIENELKRSASPQKAEIKDIIDPWYDNFNPKLDWLPENASEEDYTEAGCRALERKFWRELGLGEACWYGADMKGSLFTEETTKWNVANLPNVLNRLNLKKKLPGVNTPYLYLSLIHI